MWQKPWTYKEGVCIGCGLAIIGWLLQITVGNIDWSVFAWPTNLIVLIAFIFLLFAFHCLRKKIYLFYWLSTNYSAVTSIGWATFFTVIMGLIRQVPFTTELDDFTETSGLRKMLSAWPFVLEYVWMTTSLGMTIIRKIFVSDSFSTVRKIRFYLMHCGLFIVLTCGVLGNADMQRLEMTCELGKAEWRATDKISAGNNIVELPLAIELQHFTIDEYPPKLMVVDNETGNVLPEGKPKNVLLENLNTDSDFNLLGWKIEIIKTIENAAMIADPDTVNFVEFHGEGSCFAALVKAEKDGISVEGWVSCGSFMFPYKSLKLNEKVSIIMPEREPRSYKSLAKVYTQDGKIKESEILVNKPFKINGWSIYQLSYDENMGKWSNVSVFELVKDPWLPAVYAGIFMLLAGAVMIFLTAGMKKERSEA